MSNLAKKDSIQLSWVQGHHCERREPERSPHWSQSRFICQRTETWTGGAWIRTA